MQCLRCLKLPNNWPSIYNSPTLLSWSLSHHLSILFLYLLQSQSCSSKTNQGYHESGIACTTQEHYWYVVPAGRVLSGAHSVAEFAEYIVLSLDLLRDGVRQSCPDVSPYINILPFPSVDTSKPQKVAIRQYSVKIWNSCNHLSTSDNPKDEVDLVKLRAFACLLLASIVTHKPKNLGTRTNLFQNALVAGRACLRAQMFDLADKLLQNEGAFGVLEQKDNKANGLLPPPFLIEYYCLRALLEWKRKRPDLTDYWYRRARDLQVELQESDIEKIVDLCYEIGRDGLSHNDSNATADAATWLERAQSMLDQQDCSHVLAGSELRLNVMHSLGTWVPI